MRLHGQLARIAADLRTARSRSSRTSALTALAILAVLAACQGDVLTTPRGVGPTPPDLTLTGGLGTQIFPAVPLGEYQARGEARGLNEAGQVVGSGWVDQIADDAEAFRWSVSTGAQVVTGACCGTVWGNDINSAGTIVGTSQVSQITGNRGFVAAAGSSATRLSILPGGDPEADAAAVAINDAGQTVGFSPANGFDRHAVLWSAAGVIQDLGTLGGTNSQAIDINASAQVIGSSQIAGDAATHFFLWSSSTGMLDLNTTVDAGITDVVEINDAGQIIGSYTTGGHSHAFLYTPGPGLRDLGTLGGTTSAPTGLNSRGDVVGSSTLSDGSTHAFLWTAADGREDITALSGVPEVRRLNNNLQTLTGTGTAFNVQRLLPRLVQLQVTQSNAPPTALFTAECNGLTCVLDGSGSLDDKPGLTFAWDLNKFPGGSATGSKVTVIYPHSGQRTVTLTVTDAQGLQNSISQTLTITDFPIASFTANCVGLTCTFDGTASTSDVPPLEFAWRFGDGQTDFNTATTTHTYAQPGVYSVTLQVLDSRVPGQFAFVTKQVTIAAATNQPPTASFTYTCAGQAFPHQCAFNASGSTDDNGIVSYAWSWGNGRSETKTAPTARNTWAAPGTYTVTLTTKDAGGLTASVSQQVVVP